MQRGWSEVGRAGWDDRLTRVGGAELSLARSWVAPTAAGALFVLALLPRIVGGPVFVTPDEDNWMRRTGNFARALERGPLERT